MLFFHQLWWIIWDKVLFSLLNRHLSKIRIEFDICHWYKMCWMYIWKRFYRSVPSWAHWPMVILSTIATSLFVSLGEEEEEEEECFVFDSNRITSNNNGLFFSIESSWFIRILCSITCWSHEWESDWTNLCSGLFCFVWMLNKWFV